MSPVSPAEALVLARPPRAFFERPTADVARELVGKLLVRPGTPTRIARIVEVEAYLGEQDAASHARRGPTPRAAIMFGPAGYMYVYLVYGMHHCMNVVTEKDGIAGAVLIRAAEPIAGFADVDDGAHARMERTRAKSGLLSGPGKLCAGFAVTRADNGLDLCRRDRAAFFIAEDGTSAPRIKCSARIGVAYAGTWAARRLRFYIPGNPHVSARPRD
jgi:DNA-3-methyladenine glycosylase